ncbi:nuclease EXOG, mitochondrial-like [Liolophura sinensis]|uniref:nuclease EXOG, mitochondrial-like n=1 Tax=Liolophura sinensis TaxID=3198878 RepID=UPI003158211A
MRVFGSYSRGFLSGSALSLSCCAVWYGLLSPPGLRCERPHLSDSNLPVSSVVDTDHSLEDIHQLDTSREILKYGVPDRGPVVRSYSGHALAYDQARRVPVWVAEHLTPDSVVGPAHRKHSKFKPDPNIPAMFSAQNKDFLQSGGWSRGHMAPAGDFKHSQAAMNSTFYLTNVVPQNYENNAGYWNRFEIFCRDLTRSFSDIRVFTGPLFLPNVVEGQKKYVKYEVIGESTVAVPTHLYKLIVAENNSSDQKAVGAFVVPNEPLGFDHKLTEYQVTLEALEGMTGTTFLPLINQTKLVDLCTVDTCQLLSAQKFELHVLSSRLRNAKNREKLDKIWSELESKKLVPDTFITEIYEKKRKEFEIKEKQKSEL